uniref:Uncharacterized protein n=2 Tax=Oryza sativa subsp. japonica TaxID=39947 RepID=Q6Z191_ORYSJ|nr:hypothetical protein [Oryza sativa Japonica Group]BAD03601.1 hypothetical protein [Oryza sativa Japonica Group]
MLLPSRQRRFGEKPIDSFSKFKSTSRDLDSNSIHMHMAAHFQIQTQNTKSSLAQIKHHNMHKTSASSGSYGTTGRKKKLVELDKSVPPPASRHHHLTAAGGEGGGAGSAPHRPLPHAAAAESRCRHRPLPRAAADASWWRIWPLPKLAAQRMPPRRGEDPGA